MNSLIQLALSIFIVGQLLLWWRAYYHCQHGRSFSLTRWLSPLSMFVWGDVLLIAPFWAFAGLVSIVSNDILIFFLIASTFYLVRAIGETIYWFLQQFSETKRDKPKDLVGYSVVKNESIYFLYQLMWQILTVIFLLTTVYLFHLWLK